MQKRFTRKPETSVKLFSVQVTPQLSQQLGALSLSANRPHTHAADTLIRTFREWKQGDADGSYFFSRESLPAQGKYLAHAHMVPLNLPRDLTQWNHHWQLKRRRTSDRYLLYADGGVAYGFLLIAIINDPGAHALWHASARAQRSVFEQIAEQFCVFGRLPSATEQAD